MPRNSVEHFRRSEHEASYLRLVVALGAAAGLHVYAGPLSPAEVLAFAIGCAVYTGYALSLRYLLLPRTQSIALAGATMLVDVVALLGVTYVAGGPSTAFDILFPVFIIYYSIPFGYIGSFGVASMSSLGIVGYEGLLRGGTVDPSLPLAVTLLFIIAAVSGYSGQRSIREEEENVTLQGMLAVETGASGLLEAAATLSATTTNPQALMESLVRLTPDIVHLTGCIALLYDEGTNCFVAQAANVTPEALGLPRLEDFTESADEGSCTGRACRLGEPVALAGLGLTPSEELPPNLAERAGTLLAIPLGHRGKALGLLYAFELAPTTLTTAQLGLARGLGELSSIALANSTDHQHAQKEITALARELSDAMKRLDQHRRPRQDHILRVDSLELDTETQRATLRGRPVDLSPTEFKLLRALVAQAGVAMSADTLFRKTWGNVYQGRANTVDVYIHRLRRKLESEPSSPTRIVTVRGVGYKLTTPGSGTGSS